MRDSDVQDALEQINEFVSLHVKSGEVSPLLICQLACHWLRIGERYGDQHFYFNVHAVFDAIAWLEGTGRFDPTKAPERFSGQLEGLWHKHFIVTSAASFARNMRQALTDETFMKLWHTQFKKRREAAGLKDEVRVAALAGLIGDTFVTDLLLHRHGSLGTRRAQNKMTGEWIVFDKTTGGRNVYLALATHNETNQQILARIQTMVAVYPDLANLSGLKTAA